MIDISIIVPYYKDYQRLLSLLSALNEQTLPKSKWEILLINNDSAQPLILEEFYFQNLPLFIFSESKPGSYVARNKGISEAKGKILAFTDSDCVPDKDWLKNAFKFFQSDFKHEIGVLTGPIQLFYKNPNSLSDTEIFEKYTAFTTEAYSKSGRAITANWFSYADVIHEFNGFDSTLKSNGDSELSGRISQRYQVAYQANIIIKHPARYELAELKSKYRRLLGGKYSRKYQGKRVQFLIHIFDFCLRQYRFALKKFLTIPIKESIAIFKICNSLNWIMFQEYFDLIKGKDTKR